MDVSNFEIIDGLFVVVIGFGMVFIILFIISFILNIFSFVYKLKEKKKLEQQTLNKQIKSDTLLNEEKISGVPKKEDNLELVAVITAAIAASANTTSDKIIVHSIRKTSNWNKTAISENLKNFY